MPSVIVGALLLGACHKGPPPAQLVVSGDKFEITIPELEQVLRQAPSVRKEDVAPARRALLQALIGEKLLSQAAVSEGLDKRQEVVWQLAASRRAILAAAYVDRLVGDNNKPDSAAISRFYDERPALFKNRVELTIHEYALPTSLEGLNRYVGIEQTRGFDALASTLTAEQPGIVPITRTILSSDLSPEGGDRALRMKAGENVTYRTPDAMHLGQVTAIRSSPVLLSEAHDLIGAILQRERRATLARAAVEDLRQRRHVKVVNAQLAQGGAR